MTLKQFAGKCLRFIPNCLIGLLGFVVSAIVDLILTARAAYVAVIKAPIFFIKKCYHYPSYVWKDTRQYGMNAISASILTSLTALATPIALGIVGLGCVLAVLALNLVLPFAGFVKGFKNGFAGAFSPPIIPLLGISLVVLAIATKFYRKPISTPISTADQPPVPIEVPRTRDPVKQTPAQDETTQKADSDHKLPSVTQTGGPGMWTTPPAGSVNADSATAPKADSGIPTETNKKRP